MLIGLRDGMAASKKKNPYLGLCFTAEQANSSVLMKNHSNSPNVSLQYSTDGTNWLPFVVNTTTVTLANVGDRVWIKGTNFKISTGINDVNWFKLTGKIAASGNIMSLLDETLEQSYIPANAFQRLFFNWDNNQHKNDVLTQAPEIPVQEVRNNGCDQMFYGCTALEKPPSILPATDIYSYAYAGMFAECYSLKSAPALSMVLLNTSCCEIMFRNCTSLVKSPRIPQAPMAGSCYKEMFSGCSNLSEVNVDFTGWVSGATYNWLNGVSQTGTFCCPTSLGTDSTITRGTSNCPNGWIVVNK